MKITIPKPCHENWADMTPDEKGRFCAVCSKTVHDFTGFSDEELVTRFNPEEGICGKFREDQLNKNLNFSIAGTLALGLLVGGSFVNTVHAQETKPHEIKSTKPTAMILGKPLALPKPVRTGAPLSQKTAPPLIIINGKKSSIEEMKKLPPDDIENVTSLLLEDAVKRYGKDGKNGVLMITTKRK
ncbi:hypothetical protein [Chryseobacterium sp. JK1]|uniref:hypothetical protein n=1 Tax=Chryseobacterium sp. JK1 TaxID=874294 RepID=UPI003D685355